MLKYVHGSREGLGSCLEVDIENQANEYRAIFKLFRQSNDSSSEGADGERWQFDDPCPAIVELNAQQIARVIAVLCNASPSIATNKGGMSVDSAESTAVFFLERVSQPYDGYNLHIKQSWPNGDRANNRILLNINEAICLRLALQSVMDKLAFGNKHK